MRLNFASFWLNEIEFRQLLGELLLRIRIRKQVLDALESGLRRGFEAVEKIHLVVEHGQIGCKLGHGVVLSEFSWPRRRHGDAGAARTHGCAASNPLRSPLLAGLEALRQRFALSRQYADVAADRGERCTDIDPA